MSCSNKAHCLVRIVCSLHDKPHMLPCHSTLIPSYSTNHKSCLFSQWYSWYHIYANKCSISMASKWSYALIDIRCISTLWLRNHGICYNHILGTPIHFPVTLNTTKYRTLLCNSWSLDFSYCIFWLFRPLAVVTGGKRNGIPLIHPGTSYPYRKYPDMFCSTH